jgi:hypothetical protein
MILEKPFKPGDLHISLSRRACLGTCPVFELTIDGTGNVNYCGKDFVKVTGIRITTIDPDQVFKLLQYAVKIGFFNFKSRYNTALTLEKSGGLIKASGYMATDMPESTVTISVGNRFKTVTESLGAPLALISFQKKIERTAGISDWI